MSAVHFGPMLRRLGRDRASAALLAVELAFALTVAVHATSIPLKLLERSRTDVTLDSRSLWVVSAWEATGDPLRQLPGVTAIAQVERPLQHPSQLPLTVRGTRPEPAALAWTMRADAALPRVLGGPMLEGRWPEASDEVAITESLARALFAQGRATGETLLTPDAVKISGVLPDVVLATNWAMSPKHALLRALEPAGPRTVFMVRSDRSDFPELARRALAEHAPVTVERLSDRIAFNNANASGTLYVIALMVAVLLVITAFGASAMVALRVARRTREIGLRRALGARREDVVLHFVFEAGAVVAAGLVLGLGLTALVSAVAGPPSTALVVGALAAFGAVALVSAWLPARKAALIPPSVAGRAP